MSANSWQIPPLDCEAMREKKKKEKYLRQCTTVVSLHFLSEPDDRFQFLGTDADEGVREAVTQLVNAAAAKAALTSRWPHFPPRIYYENV